MSFPTGDTSDVRDTWYFRLRSPDWCIQIILNQIAVLTNPNQFRQVGTATPQDAADYFQEMLDNIYPSPLFPAMTMVSFRETIPDNWLECDGSLYNRVDYPELYAALDPTFHVDADTFAVPDLRRHTVYGAGGSWNVGDDVGQEEVTLDVLQMPSHSHTDLGHTHTEVIALPSTAVFVTGAPIPSAVPGASVTGIGNANLTNSGGDMAHENVSPGVIGRWIMYTGL